MCGRYKQKAEADELIKHFELADKLKVLKDYKPSNEIFPGTPVLAINNKFEPEFDWWTIRDKDWQGRMQTPVNAKAENLLKSNMFRNAFINDRVLIPATGLYEWQTQPDKKKVRYNIWFDDNIFAFAGIARDCEILVKKEPQTKRCTVIVTTYPNKTFKWIHNERERQAVVIRKEDYDKWLDPDTPLDELQKLLKPLPDDETHYERVK